MKYMIVAALFAACGFAADTRRFDQPCSAVYPAVVQSMTAQHFETKVSDAAGGVLTMNYTGEPMVWNFMVKHAKPFLAKYVEGGDKLHGVNGLTYTGATFGFTADDGGCRVRVSVTLATIGSKANTFHRPGEPSWVRVDKAVPSNGTAESELLSQLEVK